MTNQKLDLTNSMYDTLDTARRHISEIAEGDMVFVEKESCIYVKIDDDFKRLESDLNFQMTKYEINKNIYSQMPVKTKEEIKELANHITEYYSQAKERSMLLCRELNYYTVFELDKDGGEFDTLANAVVTCAQDWGEILDIAPVENTVEIWIKLYESKEPVVMYLFPCEQMFVRHRG